MSVLSRLRLSKQAAKEHKEAKANKDKGPEKPAYKHIPTHAGADALSGAPSAWKELDRPKIQAQHRRRSALASAQISRNTSFLSSTSNMYGVMVSGNGEGSAYASPAIGSAASSIHAPPIQLPRNSSYNSFYTTWNDPVSMDVRPAAKRRVQSFQGAVGTYKGNSYGLTNKMRGHSYHDSGVGHGPSPLSSAVATPEDVSPVASSKHSISSSSDNLEMQWKNRTTRQSRPEFSELDIAEQLRGKRNSPPRPQIRPGASAGPSRQQQQQQPVVKPGPMPAAVVNAEEKKKSRFSLLGKKKSPKPIAA